MSTKVSLGGDRLGSGAKNDISLKNFERSTHDLSSIWRSTTASGTLVPFMKLLSLPGDTFDIDLDVDVKTHPTIAPMFGSYKIQLDVFSVPIRLYQAMLHNNALGIGMDMKSVKLPQLQIEANSFDLPNIESKDIDNIQINSSSLLNYLGIKGVGYSNIRENFRPKRNFNAVPYLAYWDIYKNYYANKQEEVGYLVDYANDTIVLWQEWNLKNGGATNSPIGIKRHSLDFGYIETQTAIGIEDVSFTLSDGSTKTGTEILENWVSYGNNLYTFNFIKVQRDERIITEWKVDGEEIESELKLTKFELDNIDKMQEEILASGRSQVYINSNTRTPYGIALKKAKTGITDPQKDYIRSKYEMVGLALKTYQSDLFNNWLSTEWVDGVGGINEITAIDVSAGSFTIDTLNLSNKVYNMLNRIAVSGGTYRDWITAVYSHNARGGVESPVYMGGLAQELAFGEVTSTASTEDEDLGGLAGKGMLAGKKKGGSITIRTDEPSYIIGIFSLTPRVDYSQGNDWDNNLKTFDDLHKPGLDGIGFQELITDQMAWWDTRIEDDFEVSFKSAGKVPAWINYMTAVNETFGNFADRKKEIYMTLNRNYEHIYKTSGDIEIKDLTTYIDPSKFNDMFARTDLKSQNFWVQISKNITARRKMSAKVMPNL